MIDQVFQDLHRGYDRLVHDLKHDEGLDVDVDIWEAVEIICKLWNEPWCSFRQRRRAFRAIGLDESKISIDFVPTSQFQLGDALAVEHAPAPAAPECEYKEPTPDAKIKRGTKKYFEKKVECMRPELHRLGTISLPW